MWTSLVVGGAMAFTFLRALGHKTGSSLMDIGKVEECKEMLRKAGDRMILPVDVVALGPDGEIGCGSPGKGEVQLLGRGHPDRLEGPRHRPEDRRGVRGRGPRGRDGPLERADGRVRGPQVRCQGRRPWQRRWRRAPGMTVVGGGDSVAALDELGLTSKVSFVSTGGGATLELIEYGDLPGLEALRAAPNAPHSRQAAPICERHRAPSARQRQLEDASTTTSPRSGRSRISACDSTPRTSPP